jgi:hypothetical protein
VRKYRGTVEVTSDGIIQRSRTDDVFIGITHANFNAIILIDSERCVQRRNIKDAEKRTVPSREIGWGSPVASMKWISEIDIQNFAEIENTMMTNREVEIVVYDNVTKGKNMETQ